MITVPEKELYGLFQNQLKFQESLSDSDPLMGILPPIDIGATIRQVFGTLDIPETVRVLSLDSAKAAYSYKKDAIETALFFPEEGDLLYYFRLRPTLLLEGIGSDPFPEFKTNLEAKINSIVEAEGSLSKKLVLGILVPFMGTGALQRKGFFKEGGLALYGDWVTVDPPVLAHV